MSMVLAARDQQTRTHGMPPFRDTLASGGAETGESVTPRKEYEA